MKREIKRVKKFGAILLLNKMKSGAKRVVFFSYRCFLESETLRCEKIFSKRVKFFVHVRHFKAVFSNFLVKRFGCDFLLVLGWCW